MTGIMADLEDIWVNAIEKELEIPKQDLNRYKVNIYLKCIQECHSILLYDKCIRRKSRHVCN